MKAVKYGKKCHSVKIDAPADVRNTYIAESRPLGPWRRRSKLPKVQECVPVALNLFSILSDLP